MLMGKFRIDQMGGKDISFVSTYTFLPFPLDVALPLYSLLHLTMVPSSLHVLERMDELGGDGCESARCEERGTESHDVGGCDDVEFSMQDGILCPT